MMQGFTFDHDGRTFVCTVERRTAAPAGWWWWFAVSSDQQRYAPFEVADNDNQTNVKKRIAAYYDNLLVVRARPVEPRHHFSRPGRPKTVVAAPEAD